MNERLNKVIAAAGIASRRAADQLIQDGRVTVNGETIRELGTRVDAGQDAIKVDGRRLPTAPAHPTYVLLNKPRGCLTTLSDPEGRPTVRELLRGIRPRVFPVGRLDFNTEGLLLLTDDGDLARDLMHPRSKVEKVYHAKVRRCPDKASLAKLERGITIERRRTLPARFKLLRRADNPWVEVRLTEGRKHQVRLMLEAIGHPVSKLRRVGYGGLDLGDLASGQWRMLEPREVDRLRRAVARQSGASEKRPIRRN